MDRREEAREFYASLPEERKTWLRDLSWGVAEQIRDELDYHMTPEEVDDLVMVVLQQFDQIVRKEFEKLRAESAGKRVDIDKLYEAVKARMLEEE
jgi:hypothetical protein